MAEEEDKVPLVNTSGEVHYFDREEASTLLAGEWMQPTEEYVREYDKQQSFYQDNTAKQAAFATGLANAPTLGLSDLLLSQVGLGQKLRDYDKYLPSQRQFGEIAGMALSAGAMMGSGAIAKTVAAPLRAATAPGRILLQGMKPGIRRTMLQEAVDGAVIGGMMNISDQTVQHNEVDPELLAEAVLSGAGTGAAFGGMLAAPAAIARGTVGLLNKALKHDDTMRALGESGDVGLVGRAAQAFHDKVVLPVQEWSTGAKTKLLFEADGPFGPGRKAGQKIWPNNPELREMFGVTKRWDDLSGAELRAASDGAVEAGRNQLRAPIPGDPDGLNYSQGHSKVSRYFQRNILATDEIIEQLRYQKAEAKGKVAKREIERQIKSVKAARKRLVAAVAPYEKFFAGNIRKTQFVDANGNYTTTNATINNTVTQSKGKGIRVDSSEARVALRDLPDTIKEFDDILETMRTRNLLPDESFQAQENIRLAQTLNDELENIALGYKLNDLLVQDVKNPQQESTTPTAKIMSPMITGGFIVNPALGVVASGAAGLASLPMQTNRFFHWLYKKTGVTQAGQSAIKSQAKKVPGVKPQLKIPSIPAAASVMPFRSKSGDDRSRMKNDFIKMKQSFGQEERLMAEVADLVGRDPYYREQVLGATMVAAKARDTAMMKARMLANGFESPDAEVFEFNETVRGCKKPLKLLKDVADGNFTVSQARAIEKVYPKLFNQMKQEVIGDWFGMVQNGQVLPPETTSRLSLAFRYDFDGRFNKKHSQTMQQFFEMNKGPAQGGSAPSVSLTFENRSEIVQPNERKSRK